MSAPFQPPRHGVGEFLLKASGSWPYLSDFLTRMDSAHYVHLVRSPFAHARLLAWDAGAALDLPGVHSVWGPADVPGARFNSAAAPPAPQLARTGDQLLLTDEAQHVGDACLAVVLDSPRLAGPAERALACQWKDFPTERTALGEAPRMGRISSRERWPAEVPAEAVDVQVHAWTSAVEHLCLEGPAALAVPHPDGSVTVHTNTQAPSDVRRLICDLTGMPAHTVRVVKYQEGGGFGGKQEVYEEPLLVHLAVRTGLSLWSRRSIRTTLAAGRTRHAAALTARVRADALGHLEHIDVEGRLDSGAYASHVAYVMGDLAAAPTYLYPRATRTFSLDAHRTHRIPGGAFRGYGAPQALLAVEQAVDEAARTVGLSPFEIRRRNAWAHRPKGSGAPPEPSRMRDVLDLAEEAWSGRPAPEPSGRFLHGQGVAACAMLSTTVFPTAEGTTTLLRMNEDGTLTLTTGSCDCGTGSSLTLATVAATALGVDPADVGVVEGDTDLNVVDLGSFAQRTAYVAGASVHDAAQGLRLQVLERAGERYGARPDELTLSDRAIKDRDGRVVAALRDFAREESLTGRALAGTSAVHPAGLPMSYAAVVVSVDVDPVEGTVHPRRAVLAADCGTVLSPLRVRGQLEGAFAQGLSAALYERWHPDPAGRGPSTLLEHRSLGPLSLPELTVLTLDAPETDAALGAKGVGELGLPAVAPAIANAVRDAIGCRASGIPLDPVEIHSLIHRNR
jgi:CO/xanthine dehydrogenase Mo-binding subunit